jgi:hypothetical protein
LLFARVLAEWSALTVPYARITRIKYRRFPLVRLIALLYLVLGPVFCVLVLLGPGGVWGALTAFLIGLVPGLPMILILWRVPPRHLIEFRARNGTRTQLRLYISGRALRNEFVAKLNEYRTAAQEFGTLEAQEPLPPGPGRWIVAGLLVALVLTAGGVAYLSWTEALPWAQRVVARPPAQQVPINRPIVPKVTPKGHAPNPPLEVAPPPRPAGERIPPPRPVRP